MGYKIRYKFEIEKGDFTREQCQEWGGGCDAFMFVSILRPEDGSLSTALVGRDGGRPDGDDDLPDSERFKAFAALAHELKDSKELGEGMRQAAAFTLQLIQAALLSEGNCPRCGDARFREISDGDHDEWYCGFRCDICLHTVKFDYRMPRPVRVDQDLRG